MGQVNRQKNFHFLTSEWPLQVVAREVKAAEEAEMRVNRERAARAREYFICVYSILFKSRRDLR